jgi:hypothetical protein
VFVHTSLTLTAHLPATYVQEKANREAEEKKRAGAAKKDGPDVGDLKPRRLEDFPEIKDGEK